MPAPNDAELVSVVTRDDGGVITDVTLNNGNDFDIVLNAEVGSALFGTGGSYTIGYVLRDLSAGGGVIASATTSGAFGDATWPALALEHTFDVAGATIPAALVGHLLEAHAFLLQGGVGGTDPDASFATSPMAIVV